MKKVELDKSKLFDRTENPGKGLSGKFIFPPFSVLRAADKDWLYRKRQWLKVGIKSEIGRDDGLLIKDKNTQTLDTKKGEKWEPGGKLWQNSGTSIFDPVLCELIYTWFCPIEGSVLDPFAGGSVRGIVATFMGYTYWGSELREEQVLANRVQGEEITPTNQPVWVHGDSNVELLDAPMSDLIFSCPPYGDMEVYSDLTEDLSNKKYDEFLVMYRAIIVKACAKLKRNRFACFVVGNFRDKKTGFYYDFVGDTVRAFTDAGLHYYNEGVLVTSIGSLPLRTGKQFNAGRKLGKAHQNFLVFFKGDASKIKTIFGKV